MNGPRLILALTAALIIAAAGCVTAPVKLEGKPTGSLSLPLKGVYKATVRAPFVGPISARITAEPAAPGFIANSRPGVAWDMIGGVRGFLGQVFVPFLFPGGIILKWESQLPDHGKPGDGWLQVGGIRSAGAKTRMTDPNSPIDLLTPDGRRAAVMILEPCPNTDEPLDNYQDLGARLEQVFRSNLYDPGLIDSSSVRAYFTQLRSSSSIARDDLEFLFGQAVAARSNLKMPMPIAIRPPDEASKQLRTTQEELATVHATRDESTGIATIKVEAFFESEDVDKAFRQVIDWGCKGLIIDIRNCPGVTLASLRCACWLVDHPTDAGFLFGPGRREEALAGRMDGFPRAEIASVDSANQTEVLLAAQGAAALVIEPEKDRFSGPVALLISRRTTTSAEPLAWLLKSVGRARLFGTTTVGRPMLSRPIDIGNGWALWLSAFDYSPATGDRLNDRGVDPDYESSNREQLFKAATSWLKAQIAAPGPAIH